MTNPDTYLPSPGELKDWVHLTAQGDQAAFARLLRSFWIKVYTQALTYLKEPPLAQEVTQDVFVKIWNGRAQLHSIDHFPNFLFIVSRNAILSQLRKKIQKFSMISEDMISSTVTPDQQLLGKEYHSRVIQLIERLPPARRTVFKMSRFDNLSYEEIATTLGISRNGVKDHIVKALNFLRTQLQAGGDDILLPVACLLAFSGA